MKCKLLFIFCFFIFNKSYSQSLVKDSCISFPFFGIGIGAHMPGGDMKKRFGNDVVIHGLFGIKTSKNFVYNVQGGFFFGNNVKENQMLAGIATSSGNVIGSDGRLAEVRFYERGWHVDVGFGKIFSIKKPNPNSGFIATINGGFIQHKIRIENPGNTVYQLNKKYREGYDRLTNGIQIHEFIGFISFGNKKLINYFIGFDLMQGFTEGRRSYQYDLMMADDEKRVDLFYGIKVGWILPFYTKPDKFYYN